MNNTRNHKFIFHQLTSSDHLLRVRALQNICSEKAFYTNNVPAILILINLFSSEEHPKVIRWFAYTFAIIDAGVAAIDALIQKTKQIFDEDVREWLIASTKCLELSNYKLSNIYPVELGSKDDFDIGVIKSWGYKDNSPELMKYLMSALSHSKSHVRKWAALSIGNKSDISPEIKTALKESFQDDDYLVREWAMYAVKEFADELDLVNYTYVLEKETNVRAREWAVKGLPYTKHRDVPRLLVNEVEHSYFRTDPLYAESVITAMANYSEYGFVIDKMMSAVNDGQEDLVILAAINNLLKASTFISKDKMSEILSSGYKTVENGHVKNKIAMYLVDQLDMSEKQNIYNILNNEIASKVLFAIISPDNASQVISDIFYESIMLESQDTLCSDSLNDNDRIIENIGSNVLAEVVGNVVANKKILAGTKIFIGRNIIMGDQNNVKQAVAVGSHASAENVTLNQVVMEDGQQPNFNLRLSTDDGSVMEAEKENTKMGTEKILIFSFGIVFIITMLVLAIAFPNPTNFQYNVFRIILALAIAGIAAFIPGFINLKLGSWLKAGGALAVFAIVYFFNPAQLVSAPQDDPKQHEFTDKSPLEKAIAQARKDGLNYTEPSSSLVLAKTVTGYQFSNTKAPLLITTVSPFKPTKQNTIFYANSCWAIGIVVDENSVKGLAKIDVKRLSCIDNSGKAYEYGFTDSSNKRIGYVSSKETIGHDWIIALKDKNKLIIPSEKDVLINIETPINNLKLMGNINNTKALLDRLQDK